MPTGLAGSEAGSLLDAYKATVRAADQIDVVEKALVVNVVVSSGRAAAARLRTRAIEGDQDAARIDAFTTALAGEDYLRQGTSLASTYKTHVVTFLGAVGGVIGTVLAFIIAGSGADGGAGSTAIRPIATFNPYNFTFRPLPVPPGAMTVLVQHAPQIAIGLITASGALVAWWNKELNNLMQVGSTAQLILAANLDAKERQFFSGTGGQPPVRPATSLAGPAGGLAWIAGSALVVGVIVRILVDALKL